MSRFSKFTFCGSVILLAVCVISTPLFAAVTRTNDNITATANAFYPYDPQNATYGVTTFNMTGANTAPVLQIVRDDENTGNANNGGGEGGLGLQSSVIGSPVGENVGGPNRVIAQTFTPTSTFQLGAIAILAGGNGSVFTDGNSVVQTMAMNIHMYQLTTGYTGTPGGTGGNSHYGGYIVNTSGPGSGPAPDLFGGGSGLSFTTFGQPNSWLELNFTGSDRITLQAGQHYAFEIAPDYTLSTANPSVIPIFYQRISGGVPFYSGNPYDAGNGYFYTQTQDNDTATTRGNIAGSDRDFFMALYAAPTPTILKGDLNFDGHVNATDIGIMELALTNLSSYLSTYGTANGVTSANIGNYSDVTGGGVYNNGNLQSLLTLLKSGGGSATSVPEPASLVLLGLAGPGLLWAFCRTKNKSSNIL